MLLGQGDLGDPSGLSIEAWVVLNIADGDGQHGTGEEDGTEHVKVVT